MRPLLYLPTGNVPIDTVMEYWRENCQRPLRWFNARPTTGKPICIVGGAPSLNDTLESIRDKRRQGAVVWALNNAWRTLQAACIKFDAVLVMDSRPENVAFLDGAPDVEFLMSATVHPSLLDALAGRNVTLWFPDQGQHKELAIIRAARPRDGVLVAGGGTVGLRATVLAHARGYRRLHLYGMDSSYRDGEHHAYPQALNDGERTQTVHLKGKTYLCAPWMSRQADEFKEHWHRLGEKGVTIVAHGSGLLPDICRYLNADRARGKVNNAA